MRARLLIVAAIAAFAASAAPASAGENVCVGETCVYADAGCVIGSLKGQQYFAPCVRIRRP